jgi:hypothetical protein
MRDERIHGTCDGGNCDRTAVSLAFDWNAGLIPVCRRHITAYRVLDGKFWQAEDEYAQLRFCRRSRFKWLAQWKILLDQRAATNGRTGRGQARKTRRADQEATR